MAVSVAVVALAGPALSQEKPLFVVNSREPSSTIGRARFLPDGKSLVTISGDKIPRIWDAGTGTVTRVIRTPAGHGLEGQSLFLAVNGDGTMLAISSLGPNAQGRVYLLSLPEGKLVRTLDGEHKDYVFGIAFSPDGKLLATAGEDKTARLWDVTTGKVVEVLKGHAESILGVAFSPDGKSVVTGSMDKTARVWDVATGQEQAKLTGHAFGVRPVDWSDDGRLIATGSFDGTTKLWQPNGQLVRTIDNGKQPVFDVRFTPGSKRVGTVSAVRRLGNEPYKPTHYRLYTVADGSAVATSKDLDGSLQDLSFSPDGKRVAVSGGYAGETRVFDAASGKEQLLLKPVAFPVMVVGWRGDGQGVYWGGGAEDVVDLKQRKLHTEFRFDTLTLTPLDAAPTQAVLNRRLTNQATGVGPIKERSFQFYRNGVPVSNIALADKYDFIRSTPSLAPNDGAVVFGSETAGWVFNTTNGQLLNKLDGHFGTISDAVFSGNGDYIVTGGKDRTVRVWKFGSSTPLVSLFVAGTEWIAWTPEGYYAASPGGEKLVGWQINNGPNKPPTVHPAERFHDSLYRPDVIKRLLAHGNLDDALKAADRAKGHQSRKIDVTQVEPPTVRFLKKPVPDQEGKVRVDVVATSPAGQGITNLRLLINDRPFGGAKADRPKSGENATETASWSGVLLLPNRENRIKVLVETAASRGASEEVSVTFAGEAPKDVGKLRVLTVGVSKYDNAAVRQLQFSGKGADRLEKVFDKHSTPSPYGGVTVASIRDRQATKANILSALDQLAKESTDADTVLVYLSGHGTTAKADKDRWLFCPVEFDPDRDDATGLADKELRKKFDNIRANRLVVLLDACNSGAASRVLTQEGSDPDLYCSSLATQLSEERNELQLPLFTAALCDKLADRTLVVRSDDLVGVLFDSVAASVKSELFTSTQRRQTPQYHPSKRGPLFLTNPK